MTIGLIHGLFGSLTETSTSGEGLTLLPDSHSLGLGSLVRFLLSDTLFFFYSNINTGQVRSVPDLGVYVFTSLRYGSGSQLGPSIIELSTFLVKNIFIFTPYHICTWNSTKNEFSFA